MCRGDDACRVRVSWDEADESNRERLVFEERISVLQRRLAQFQETVADLVLGGDLDRALEGVVASVAFSIRAPGFVLAVHPLPGRPKWVYAHGVEPEEAERIGHLMLRGEPCTEVGDLVVEVASSHRSYGRLAVLNPNGMAFDDNDMLSSYARLAATALDSATAFEDARREAARTRALLELAAALADITSIEAIATSLVQATPAVLGSDMATVSMADWDRRVARTLACHAPPGRRAGVIVGSEMPITDVGTEKILYLGGSDAAGGGNGAHRPQDGVAHVVVPLAVDDDLLGWLTATVLDDPGRLTPSEDLEARLRGLAAQAATALRNARLVEQIRHQALHDPLTGLPNRSLILDRAAQLVARSTRHQTPAAALFVDLDGFKEVNDSYGHGAGDQLLRTVAGRLSSVVRACDTVGRLGGDEFVVLLDGAAPGETPELVATRLLDAVSAACSLDRHPGEELRVTASIGIATVRPGTSAEDLLHEADGALYAAKASGKNRWAVHVPDGRRG